MTASIDAEDVSVRFQFDRQRRVLTPALARLFRPGLETFGLRGLSCTVRAGDGVALLGPSGSGKTTLLRTIAGVLAPDAGRMHVRGRVASLLSTTAGLLLRLTGRENANLLGVLHGLPAREASTRLEDVKLVSGLGDAFELPVSSYSQGMRARLAFAVADVAGPDIVLLDEVHQALDHEFRATVEDRVAAIRAAGGIVVAAGHDHELLARMCDRGILLRDGAVVADGPFEETRDAYLA